MWPDRRIIDLFKTEFPIVLAPMAGIMDADLVIAAAQGGALGSLPCAMLSAEKTREQVNIHAVLEHVPEAVLDGLVLESKRILRPGGCFYAYVGLHDHYACFDRRISKVNYLKYPEWAWRTFIKNNISYHNRLRRVFVRQQHQYVVVHIRLNHESLT